MELLDNFARRVTENSTGLLMVAVLMFFLNSLFVTYTDTNGDANAAILGTVALGSANLLNLVEAGPFFAFIGAIFGSIVILFAGLSFAAVCFDEEKNIWFRVVSVAALMLIMFGGLNIF